MIITRTPFRISFFGGGTDYPSWYRQHGGAVLGGTINKYCYISCRHLPPFFEHRIRVSYSKIETCHNIEEVQHPSVRESLRLMGLDNVEIHHDADLPARSGMGSSSAFIVGLLNALNGMRGTVVTRKQLATDAVHVEQEILKETVGSQDQVFAAYGGVNAIYFHKSGEIDVRPLPVANDRLLKLESYLMLAFTGQSRTASDVAKTYVPQMGRRQLRILRDIVDEAVNILASGSIRDFGELLHETWMEKRSLGEGVSNPEIDAMYAGARETGAIGGKILGAGGGGFMLLFAPPETHDAIREKLSGLLHVPFKFEFSGSQIIFYDRNA